MALPTALYPAVIVGVPGEINTGKDNGKTYSTIAAADKTIPGDYLNQLAVEVRAIQNTLGINPQGSLATLLLRLAVLMNTDGTLKTSAINGQTAETVIADTDEILLYDASAAALRKMVRSNLLKEPCVRAVRTTAQSIPYNATTAIQFDAADAFDTDAIHDPVTNNTRLTCVTAGKYLITGMLSFDAGAGGGREFYIRLGGATIIVAATVVPSSVYKSAGNISVIYDLAVGNYVELMCYQDQTSAGALNTSTGSYAPSFSMVRVSP